MLTEPVPPARRVLRLGPPVVRAALRILFVKTFENVDNNYSRCPEEQYKRLCSRPTERLTSCLDLDVEVGT